MSRVAVIGAELSVQGYALAGAVVYPAADAAQAKAAWRALPADVAVAILTSGAAAALGDDVQQRPGVLTVVMSS